MKYENFLPDYLGKEKIESYLRSQEIYSFRDVMNIIALWRPSSEEALKRLDFYRQAKEQTHVYSFLTPRLQVLLSKNYGRVIYHEDIIHIILEYTGWTMERASRLRRDMRLGGKNGDLQTFKELVPEPVYDLVIAEAPWTFCKSHAVSFGQLTKQTAVLRSLHKKVYFEQIERWESRNGMRWDDIGIKIKGVSLLQH